MKGKEEYTDKKEVGLDEEVIIAENQESKTVDSIIGAKIIQLKKTMLAEIEAKFSALKELRIEFEKNKDLIQIDLQVKEKSLSERGNDLSLLQDLRETKDLAEKELKNLQLITEEEKNNQVIQLEDRITALKMGNFDVYKNKIKGLEQQVPALELSIKENIQKIPLAEEAIKEVISKLDELEWIGVVVIDASRDKLTKELNKRKLNLETVEKAIKIHKGNLDKCQNAINTGLNKIVQYEELMAQKNKLLLLNPLNHQNIDNKVGITQSNIGEELVILNKEIGELEQKVINNKIKPEDLLSKKNELSNLQEKYIETIDDYINDVKSIIEILNSDVNIENIIEQQAEVFLQGVAVELISEL